MLSRMAMGSAGWVSAALNLDRLAYPLSNMISRTSLSRCCWWVFARHRLLLASLLLPIALACSAAEAQNPIGGIRFDPSVQLAGQVLQLNGTGLRARFWIKAYAAGLYLGQRAQSADAALTQPGAKRLQLRMLLAVPASEFVKALHLGVARNNPPELQARLAERVAAFDAMLTPLGEVKKGDTVNLDFLPGRGLLFFHNGRLLGPAIAGDEFYNALLRVFVGEHVSDEGLRAGLLGQS